MALLRGINVGGKNKLPMNELAGIFQSAGCNDVVTYINSGNVVFTASESTLKQLPDLIPSEIDSEFGISVPIVLRSATELARVIAANPFPNAADLPKTLTVMFLADEPSLDALSKLDPERSPGDTYKVIGRDIYCHLPEGTADSKLTNAYFDSKLSTISTGRNWTTVLKLYAMTQEVAP